jgi:hypothetical protein
MKKLWVGFTITGMLLIVGCGLLAGTQSMETPAGDASGDAAQAGEVPSVALVTATPGGEPVTEPEPETEPDGSQYWVEMQDPEYGFRFAVPCFWEVTFPQEYGEGSGPMYPIANFTQEYVATFPRGEGVWESGGMKIDLGVSNGPFWGLPAGASPADFADAVFTSPSSDVVATEDLTVNGQPALLVTVHNTEFQTTSQTIVFALTDEVFLMLSPVPAEAMQNPDIQGIIHSIALTPDVSVAVPNHVPGPPPEGMSAPCMGIAEPPALPGSDLCVANSADSAESLSLGLQEALMTNNTGSLVYDYMNDPFVIGYWGSEGALRSPQDMFGELANALLPHPASGLTFTTDRAAFPPLAGMPPEVMFGPDVDVATVIYSEGWGQDGLGAALLYIARDDCGMYYWYGMVFSREHFDM